MSAAADAPDPPPFPAEPPLLLPAADVGLEEEAPVPSPPEVPPLPLPPEPVPVPEPESELLVVCGFEGAPGVDGEDGAAGAAVGAAGGRLVGKLEVAWILTQSRS
ncbi:unnamed protein product [Discula destructiva]